MSQNSVTSSLSLCLCIHSPPPTCGPPIWGYLFMESRPSMKGPGHGTQEAKGATLPKRPAADAPKAPPYDASPARAGAGVAAGWAGLTLPADASPLALERAGQPIPQPGVPVLHGPYVVDFSDIPHDFDTLVLWV